MCLCLCVRSHPSSGKDPVWRNPHSLPSQCAPKTEQLFSPPSTLPAHTHTLKHTHTEHRLSGWSMLHLTPDVHTAGQLPHTSGNFTCQSFEWATAISHFLFFLFSCPLMFAPTCMLPFSQPSHCHLIKCLHAASHNHCQCQYCMYCSFKMLFPPHHQLSSSLWQCFCFSFAFQSKWPVLTLSDMLIGRKTHYGQRTVYTLRIAVVWSLQMLTIRLNWSKLHEA